MRLPLIVSSLFALATFTVHAGQGAKPLTKRFDRLDLNGDAAIDVNEFAKLPPSKLSKNNALDQTQAEMFAWFDEDSSASIDLGEWLEAMSAFESPDFTAVVDELDANDDGKLTWKEFNRVIHCYVSSKTSRRWFNALSGESSTVSRSRGVAFNLTSQNAKLTMIEPGDTVSDAVAPLAGPGDFVMTTGGDCFAPASSTPEDLSNQE
jgi:Ca2+-binding EF-hand superfamily protein